MLTETEKTKEFYLTGFYLVKYISSSRYLLVPYKHNTYIPRSKDVKAAVSTLFQRGMQVVCL